MTYNPSPSDALERLLRYVQVDTQSDSHNEAQTPSTACQHDLARMLAGELLELGCSDAKADEHAYVTATLPASAGAEGLPALGLIAHIDTAMDAPASGVKPHIVRYEGGPSSRALWTAGPSRPRPSRCRASPSSWARTSW